MGEHPPPKTATRGVSGPVNGRLRRLVQGAFFPLLLLGTPTAIWAGIAGGLPIPVATYLVLVVVGMIFWLAEWWLPYRPDWNRPQGDLGNDLISGTVAYLVLPIFLKPLYIALLAGAAAWLAALLAQPSGGSLWPSDWPLALQLVLMLLLGDAGRYWGHRLAHELPFLWRFHAVHHSTRRLWWWNATRQHPVDKAWFTFTEMLFPVLLGADGVVLSLYLGVTAVCGFAQHCNIDLKLGPLYWLFNVVELHRWHHSKRAAESDHNYGNNLIVYDRLFGTYFHPERQEEAGRRVGEIGLLNPDYPQTYLGQLAAPLKPGLDKARR